MLHLCFYRQVIRPDEKSIEYLFLLFHLWKSCYLHTTGCSACWGASGILYADAAGAVFPCILLSCFREQSWDLVCFCFLMIHDGVCCRIRALADLPVFAFLLRLTAILIWIPAITLTVRISDSLTSGFCAAWSGGPIFVLLLGAVFFGKITPLKSQLHARPPSVAAC